ncbi:GNAT family N-acetyltransferase [Microbulbifer harenosus]|uniref:GNAT family N-acetyltransferase n=1 Tax=Microbulbifer harenosus TaxID=2576840 RepID=A0ABY2UM89_9GAMM|nr:GNAT family N-acetyltransferase [Microbulbifer harenosus]TLM79323.1 GNAT family N-acetyltransferase [Microbulbifer harenosus]
MGKLLTPGNMIEAHLNGDALDKANIDNLTALWTAMGATPLPDHAGVLACDRWPNRFWFPREGALPAAESLKTLLRQLPARAMVPVFAQDPELEQGLRDAGYGVALEQQAMHLDLAHWQPAPAAGGLPLHRVRSADEAASWTEVCSAAFSYHIDAAVIEQLVRHPDASLWWAERNGEMVATALLFRTGVVTGIHMVGVPEDFRGLGIARSLMQAVLTHCQASGARYTTLQASRMGEGLYRQLGFEHRFQIASFRRSI